MEREEVVRTAKENLEEGERWHKKVSVREIVFGFNDGSISTLALLAGVTGGALARSEILIGGISGIIAGAISMGIGAYISLKSEVEHHQSEIERELQEIEEVPEIERGGNSPDLPKEGCFWLPNMYTPELYNIWSVSIFCCRFSWSLWNDFWQSFLRLGLPLWNAACHAQS